MRNFRELKIWQKGFQIAVDVYKLVELLPSSEKFGIASQITRAAVSIPSNIAEGSSRKSQKDFARFIEISLGSSFELETQILLARETKLVDEEICNKVLGNLDEEQKMITTFLNRLL